MANQVVIPATQTADRVTVTNATWDNKQNKGRLKVTATSSLSNTTPNLQLYIQVLTDHVKNINGLLVVVLLGTELLMVLIILVIHYCK